MEKLFKSCYSILNSLKSACTSLAWLKIRCNILTLSKYNFLDCDSLIVASLSNGAGKPNSPIKVITST